MCGFHTADLQSSWPFWSSFNFHSGYWVHCKASLHTFFSSSFFLPSWGWEQIGFPQPVVVPSFLWKKHYALEFMDLSDAAALCMILLAWQIRDAYMLKLWEDDISRLPAWCNGNSTSPQPYCQILGQYNMELPGYNTIIPYPHMNERCASLPPVYKRPSKC